MCSKNCSCHHSSNFGSVGIFGNACTLTVSEKQCITLDCLGQLQFLGFFKNCTNAAGSRVKAMLGDY